MSKGNHEVACREKEPREAVRSMHPIGQVSPNGQWVAYSSNEGGGGAEVYVRRLHGHGGRRPVSTGGGDQPVWSRDGNELFYVRPVGGDRELVVHGVGPDGAISPTYRVLFKLAPLGLLGADPIPGYDVAKDGRFVFPQHTATSPPPPTTRIYIVQDWFDDVKTKVARR